jgi:hypothetical protein
MKVTINNWPISTPFQSVDSAHKTPHKGIDFAIPQGTEVPSITDGIVKCVSDEGCKSFGKSVIVHTKDGSDVIYGHLSQFKVKVGQYVHSGDIVGLSGNTGDSTGPHLHLQIMKNAVAIDPSSYIQMYQNITPSLGMKEQMTVTLTDIIKQTILHLVNWIWTGVLNLLDIALPTVACGAIIWWMVPFFPKADTYAPKIIASSLLIYLFYTLIRGSYS